MIAGIIATILLSTSVIGWCKLFQSPRLRMIATQLNDVAKPEVRTSDHSANGRRLMAAMIGLFVWGFAPIVFIQNNEAVASALGMTTKDLLWPVVLNCLSLSASLILIFAIAVPLIPKPKPESTDSGLRQSRQNFVDGVLGFILCVLPVALVILTTAPLRTKDAQHPMLKLLEQGAPTTIMLVILTAVVLAPLVEELVFRKLLQGWLQSVIDHRVAIAIIAFGFCGIHRWPDMLALMPLALILGSLFYLTRSYAAVVVTHALFNLANVVLTVLNSLN